MASVSFLYNRPVAEHNRPGSERPPRPPRAETREIVELRQLKAEQPELASAVDMQIALVDMQRRVQSRVPLPWIQADPEWLRSQQTAATRDRLESTAAERVTARGAACRRGRSACPPRRRARVARP